MSISSNYVILESQYPFETWTPEKFLTGGKIFYSFKEVHDVKKKIEKMGSSIKYKVLKNTLSNKGSATHD